MLAAYQAALNAFISNQNMRPGGSVQPATQAGQSHEAAAWSHPHQQQPPQAQHQQQQQQQQSHAGSQQASAPASSQPAMYPVHPPHMLAYVPMLVSLTSSDAFASLGYQIILLCILLLPHCCCSNNSAIEVWSPHTSNVLSASCRASQALSRCVGISHASAAPSN